MKMRPLFGLVVLVMLLAAQTYGANSKKEQFDVQTQNLRNEFGLGHLILLREVVKSADIDAGVRDALADVCDQSEKEILAAVDDEKANPSDDDERKATAESLNTKFIDAASAAAKNDKAAMLRISDQQSRVTAEMEMIKAGKLLDTMKDLDLTSEQESAIERIVAETKKTLKKNGGSSVTRDEQVIAPLLDARKQVREKLTDEQKGHWDTIVKEKAAASSKRSKTTFSNN